MFGSGFGKLQSSYFGGCESYGECLAKCANGFGRWNNLFGRKYNSNGKRLQRKFTLVEWIKFDKYQCFYGRKLYGNLHKFLRHKCGKYRNCGDCNNHQSTNFGGCNEHLRWSKCDPHRQ